MEEDDNKDNNNNLKAIDEDDLEVPQKSLFTINTNYNSSEVNKMMKTSTNLFSHLSPLFSKTLTSFKKDKNKKLLQNMINSKSKNCLSFRNLVPIKKLTSTDKSKYIDSYQQNKLLRSHINLRNKQLLLLGPKNPPSIEDKERLTSYYKAYGNKKSLYKSPEEKEAKHNLFEKYDIKKKRYIDNYPQLTDSGNNLHLKITTPYFKNTYKANKTIDINKQLVQRVNEMTNFFLLKKYMKKIENNQKNIYFVKKMPKIHVKSKKLGLFKKENSNDEIKNENESKKKKKSKLKELELLQTKKINILGSIKFSRFRTFASNGLIEQQFESELEKNEDLKDEKEQNKESIAKKNLEKLINKKSEKHYLSLNITELFQAFKPSSRIGFSISKFENRIYLYGGFSSKIYNELWVYEIDSNKWNQIPVPQKEDPTARKNHTSIIIKDILFIYGGEIPKDRPYEDLITYNLTTNKFYFPRISPKNKINQRVGHICVGTNQTFLIQGGMDVRTHTIDNSAYFYNIYGNYWIKLECIGGPLPYRVYHCAAMVNYYSKTSAGPYHFYYPPEDFQEVSLKRIKYEGIYIFGGLNEKKVFKNDIHIIRIGHKPCIHIKPKISGPPPEPRIKAKMLFIENYYFLIIHGGVKINQNICNDITVLNLENYNWIKPIIPDETGIGKSLKARVLHEIFFNGEKLYIFGGLGEESILSMNFEVVEFEVTGFFDNYMHPDQIE